MIPSPGQALPKEPKKGDACGPRGDEKERTHVIPETLLEETRYSAPPFVR